MSTEIYYTMTTIAKFYNTSLQDVRMKLVDNYLAEIVNGKTVPTSNAISSGNAVAVHIADSDEVYFKYKKEIITSMFPQPPQIPKTQSIETPFQISTWKVAVKKIIMYAHKHISKDIYFHTFKVEIEQVVSQLKNLQKKLPPQDRSDMFYAIGYLAASKEYQSLNMDALLHI